MPLSYSLSSRSYPQRRRWAPDSNINVSCDVKGSSTHRRDILRMNGTWHTRPDQAQIPNTKVCAFALLPPMGIFTLRDACAPCFPLSSTQLRGSVSRYARRTYSLADETKGVHKLKLIDAILPCLESSTPSCQVVNIRWQRWSIQCLGSSDGLPASS